MCWWRVWRSKATRSKATCCQYCKEKHHISICIDKNKGEETNSKNSEEATTVGSWSLQSCSSCGFSEIRSNQVYSIIKYGSWALVHILSLSNQLNEDPLQNNQKQVETIFILKQQKRKYKKLKYQISEVNLQLLYMSSKSIN